MEEAMIAKISQPVIWIIEKRDGNSLKEFDEAGNETVFTQVVDQMADFKYIGLYDLLNKKMYALNLDTGGFILNGQEFAPVEYEDGRPLQLPGGVDFNQSVLQYKCSYPISVGSLQEWQRPAARSYNIGYESDLPQNYRGPSKKVKVMINIDGETLQPSVSTQYT